MKNLILILIVAYSTIAQAQKTFTLYNFTANTVTIETLMTNTGTLGSYPECHMKPSGGITVAPFAIYVLTNTAHATRFPFYSPTSVPAPTIWQRNASASATATIASNAAWLLGANQVFSWIQVRKGSDSKHVGNPTNSTQPQSETSFGWNLEYVQGLTVNDYIVNVY